MAGGDSTSDWVPIALSTDLPLGGVMRAVVGGVDMAIWRGQSGRVHAWNNRCPHRGMRLSFGFVRGDRLACIYHGWQYGEDGACRHIPAHPDLEPPGSICATAYGCAEIDGLIWASTENGEAPSLKQYDGDFVRSIAIDAPADQIKSRFESGGFPIMASNPRASNPRASNPRDGITYRRTAAEKHRHAVQGSAGTTTRSVIAGFHSVDDGRTMVHLQTVPPASVNIKIDLSQWAERLRWDCETSTGLTGTNRQKPELNEELEGRA